nr:GNAT family N-acetyltransferase [Tetragenococcus koreensis]
MENSLFSVSLWEQDSLVGFGRIIGDKGTVYQIVDVVVDPAYQGNGLGKKIMNELVSYLE